MKVKTQSEQPHLRSLDTPYTSVTLSVDTSNRNADRERELQFLARLVQALNPKIGLDKVTQSLLKASDSKLDF